MSGSTFTITNPGPFASYASAPVINQPDVAVLCIDGITSRPVAVGDAIAIHHTGILSFSYDHRPATAQPHRRSCGTSATPSRTAAGMPGSASGPRSAPEDLGHDPVEVAVPLDHGPVTAVRDDVEVGVAGQRIPRGS
jgi:hypothetical protein